MINVNGEFQQGDSERDIQEFCINSLPRGKKREDARRQQKEDSWFALTGNKMICPNARSEGQKRRWAEWRRKQGLKGQTDQQIVRLANAWKCSYQLGGK